MSFYRGRLRLSCDLLEQSLKLFLPYERCDWIPWISHHIPHLIVKVGKNTLVDNVLGQIDFRRIVHKSYKQRRIIVDIDIGFNPYHGDRDEGHAQFCESLERFFDFLAIFRTGCEFHDFRNYSGAGSINFS